MIASDLDRRAEPAVLEYAIAEGAPSWMSPLQAMRWELYQAGPDAEWLPYTRSLPIDRLTVRARCGLLWTLPLRFFAQRRFDFASEDDAPSVPSAIIEALDVDAATVIDFVAWPIGRPDQFATAFGWADVLGLDQIENPATYFGNRPLKMFRTPEAWLRADGEGVVVLNSATAGRTVGAARGWIAAEDYDHRRELARMLNPFFDPAKILVPARAVAT